MQNLFNELQMQEPYLMNEIQQFDKKANNESTSI